ncbi:hypothetical protein A0H81_08097 [Grifola frondosa]|uniref:Translation initiation factor 3 N-terminal domain-containing protein n=1 Tax=Grifola frondosa TaxID=5627 RepID=A0A1C7M4R8_GRIFR|nr:hypothetical protein A0H81_08097 [Grifola frondosa]
MFRSTCRTIVRPLCYASSSRPTQSVFCQTAHFATKVASVQKRNKRNNEIGHRWVRLVDPKTGALGEPTNLQDLLATIDLKGFFLELVSEKPDPIVKLMSKRQLFDEGKARKKAKGKGVEEKEVQLTWGVSSGDLSHKLQKVRTDLQDGHRVSVVYAPKAGQTQLSPQAMAAQVQETVDLLADVGKEWKPRIVEKRAAAIYLEGLREATKEFQIPWGTSDEWRLPLEKVRVELQQGKKVDLELCPGPKKSQRRLAAILKDQRKAAAELKKKYQEQDSEASVEVQDLEAVMEAQIQETVDSLATVGRERKPRLHHNNSVTLYFEPGAKPPS